MIVFVAETASGASLGGVGQGRVGTVYEHGALWGPLITQNHEYYRLLTSGFLHDGLLHILFNMVFLYFMGAMLEPAIGRLNFGVVYFVSLLAGSFGALLFEPQAVTVGASGACFGVLGALIVVAHYRGISIWQSGLGDDPDHQHRLHLSVSGISIGGHIAGAVAGAICGWLIIELGERRRMPAAALAGCVVVAVISVVAAIAVGGRSRPDAQRPHDLTALVTAAPTAPRRPPADPAPAPGAGCGPAAPARR